MRFGLIGCGGIGELRAAALAQMGPHQLMVVNDLDLHRAQSLATRYGASTIKDWGMLLERDDVDAVIVSTPPSLHAEMSIAALQAEKHVLCEKPLARTTDECRQMIEAAEENDRFLATGFNYRFYPSMLKARELLDSGIIGELDHIRSYTGYSASDHGRAWLHDAEVMGGGALQDNGIHLIDLTCYFLGDVADVKGFASNNVWGYDGCEDNGFVLLKSETGRIASIQASWTEWRGYRLLLELYGVRGCIRAFCFPMLTQVYWAQELGGQTKRKHFLFPKTQLMEKLKSYRWVVTRSLVQELDAFVRAVHGEDTAVATGTDGLQATSIAHEATVALNSPQ